MVARLRACVNNQACFAHVSKATCRQFIKSNPQMVCLFEERIYENDHNNLSGGWQVWQSSPIIPCSDFGIFFFIIIIFYPKEIQVPFPFDVFSFLVCKANEAAFS